MSALESLPCPPSLLRSLLARLADVHPGLASDEVDEILAGGVGFDGVDAATAAATIEWAVGEDLFERDEAIYVIRPAGQKLLARLNEADILTGVRAGIEAAEFGKQLGALSAYVRAGLRRLRWDCTLCDKAQDFTARNGSEGALEEVAIERDNAMRAHVENTGHARNRQIFSAHHADVPAPSRRRAVLKTAAEILREDHGLAPTAGCRCDLCLKGEATSDSIGACPCATCRELVSGYGVPNGRRAAAELYRTHDVRWKPGESEHEPAAPAGDAGFLDWWADQCQEWTDIRAELLERGKDPTAAEITTEQYRRMNGRGESVFEARARIERALADGGALAFAPALRTAARRMHPKELEPLGFSPKVAETTRLLDGRGRLRAVAKPVDPVDLLRSAMVDPFVGMCAAEALVDGRPHFDGSLPPALKALCDEGLVRLEQNEERIPSLAARLTAEGARELAKLLSPAHDVDLAGDVARAAEALETSTYDSDDVVYVHGEGWAQLQKDIARWRAAQSKERGQ